MGSFDMNASFSQMPILDETTVVIRLKRKLNGKVSYLPLTYPITGHYYDYGFVNNFEENEITKAICKFFEMDDMKDIIEFVYDMTIRRDYQDTLEKLKENGIDYNGNPIENLEGKDIYFNVDKFNHYVKILNKLRANSNLKVKTKEEIIKKEKKTVAKFFGSDSKKCTFLEKMIEHSLEWNEEIKKTLESYELSLFYENTPLFNALCSEPELDGEGKPIPAYWEREKDEEDVSIWGQYVEDKNNLFMTTKDCEGEATREAKRKLVRLYNNFMIESKTFSFEETSIMGQDSCPHTWYQYGKAIHEMRKKELETYLILSKTKVKLD